MAIAFIIRLAVLRLSIITKYLVQLIGKQIVNEKLLRNPKVGEILKEEFLAETGMSQNALARAIGVPANRIHAIVNGTRRVTADTDLRLCRFFRLSDGYFLRLQNAYELMEAKRSLGKTLSEIQPYVAS